MSQGDASSQVVPLLDGDFLPITGRTYFLDAPPQEVVDRYVTWPVSLPKGFAREHSVSEVHGALIDLLPMLQPLTLNGNKTLFLQTASSWTAIFVTGRHFGGDFRSALRVLSEAHRWRAVEISYMPDWTELRGRPKNGPLGGRTFSYSVPADVPPDMITRTVHASNQEPWEFHTGGAPLPFEDLARYEARRKKDRLTLDMLDAYGRALGIEVFSSDFYGPHGFLVEERDMVFEGVSLAKAQEEFGISAEVRPWKKPSSVGSSASRCVDPSGRGPDIGGIPMRSVSSEELMTICDRYWMPGRTVDYQEYVLASNELATRGPEIRDWCRGLLDHPDYDARECGAFLLGRLGQRRQLGEAEAAVVAELGALVQRPVEEDCKERQAADAAYEALTEIVRQASRSCLQALLVSEDEWPCDDLQWAAAEALGRLVGEPFSEADDPVEAARAWLSTHPG